MRLFVSTTRPPPGPPLKVVRVLGHRTLPITRKYLQDLAPPPKVSTRLTTFNLS